MKEEWLKHIHDKMSNFEVDEPEGLWDDLQRNAVAPVPGMSHRVMPLWIKRVAGIAAMLAIAVTTFILITDKDDLSAEHVTQTTRDHSDDSENKLLSSTYTEPDLCSSPIVQPAVHKSSYIPAEMSTGIIPECPLDGNDYDSVKPESSGEVAGNDNGESTTNESKPEGRPVPRVNDDKSDRIYNNKRISVTKRGDANSGRLSLGVFTSGSPNLSNNRLEYAGEVTGVLGADKASWEDNPMLGILLFNQGQDVANEVKHRLPVRTGISFAYRINNRLSIESGLLYTLLTSDLKYGSESHYIAGQQKLHYIGVPVNARYRVLSWRAFDLYASAGVLAEKCVSGKIERDFIIDNHATQSEKEDVRVKPLQWSVNASAGLQFNITRAIGLYAEPGVSCYIDNGSPVETIYNERPLNFNLNVGLRFTLGDN